MLRKFQQSKAAKGIGCAVLAVVIYYVMTDGFTRMAGERMGIGSSPDAVSSGGSWAETAVLVLLILWVAAAVGRAVWERRKGRPKNDVNVKY